MPEVVSALAGNGDPLSLDPPRNRTAIHAESARYCRSNAPGLPIACAGGVLAYVKPHQAFYMNNHTLRLLIERAQRYYLQVIDALYFEIALDLGLSMATVDRGLRTAAKSHGVKLFTPRT